MRKLIYIANARIPTEKAHGIQIMKMCESFGELEVGGEKLEVELVIPRRLNHIKKDPFEYYGIRENFKITKLPTLDLITLGFGSLGFFAETLLFLIASRIYLLFKNYDILYAREEWVGLFFKDFCMEAHSLSARPSFLHKQTWRKAKVLFVLTSFIKNELIKHGVPENKILVLPDAVDLAKFDIKISKEDARKKLNLPQDKKIVVYAGQLFDWKGIDVLTKSAELLQDVEFRVVGGVPSFQFQNTRFVGVGQRPHAEIPLWLKAADVLVLPNTGDKKISRFYTSPMKMFEYMASGRPIVASDLPSLREVLTEKEAVFFRSNDSTDLVRAIKEILQDPARAERLAENALQKVQNYTWSNRAHRAIDFINK